MSKSKPPRNKTHKPRLTIIPSLVCMLPMDRFCHDKFMMQMHAQIEYFIQQPCQESILHVARNFSILARVISHQSETPINRRTDAAAVAICSLVNATNDVQSRLDRMGSYGVSDIEAENLRKSSGVMDSIIATMPIDVFLRAEQWVDMKIARSSIQKIVGIAA